MHGILLGSLVATTALAATIYWEARSLWEAPGTASSGAAITPVQVQPLTTIRHEPQAALAADAERWAAIARARPLFREDRRPESEPAGMASNLDVTVRLTGVLTGPFGNRAIFIVTAQKAKPVSVQAGDHVGNLLVRSIEPGRVIVEGHGEARTLTPSFAAAASGALLIPVVTSSPTATRAESGSAFDG
jgi:hypothetical protein